MAAHWGPAALIGIAGSRNELHFRGTRDAFGPPRSVGGGKLNFIQLACERTARAQHMLQDSVLAPLAAEIAKVPIAAALLGGMGAYYARLAWMADRTPYHEKDAELVCPGGGRVLRHVQYLVKWIMTYLNMKHTLDLGNSREGSTPWSWSRIPFWCSSTSLMRLR